jgi:hypothetical protein
MSVRKVIEPDGSFLATDKRGKQHTLIKMAQFTYSTSLADNGAKTKTVCWIVTEDGRRVIRIGNGTYKVEATGIILRSTDPNAP